MEKVDRIVETREPPNRHEAPVEWNLLTERIIGCALEVHSALGPGLLERMYEEALVHELRCAGLEARTCARVPTSIPSPPSSSPPAPPPRSSDSL